MSPATPDRPSSGEVADRVDALSEALRKLPPLSGIVYRGGTFSDDTLHLYQPGDVLREEAFVSASRHGGAAGTVLYEIASTNGKDVSAFSADPDEAEVVFDRGTHFLVLAVEQVDNRTHVLLADMGDDRLDDAAVIRTIRAHRALAVGPGANPGLVEGKGYFPIGIGPDGTVNRVHDAS